MTDGRVRLNAVCQDAGLTWSFDNVSRADFDALPLPARGPTSSPAIALPWWTKRTAIKRGGKEVVIMWHCSEPPVTNLGEQA